MVQDAIVSYLRANDGSKWESVIEKTRALGNYEDLVKYLFMVRRKVKETKVDSELVYAFAKTGQLVEMEEFIHGTHLVREDQY